VTVIYFVVGLGYLYLLLPGIRDHCLRVMFVQGRDVFIGRESLSLKEHCLVNDSFQGIRIHTLTACESGDVEKSQIRPHRRIYIYSKWILPVGSAI
jgi:hypothetical protein